ncbi:hypothetical protein DFJ74DRAFT_681035 [Hyaloraphidium curvatum]|nr:hypothetical protein DFJ74DRAFT_681004 [Hyaloraphidium curvatum]KAI9014023.1 hypothetical protein DFJ74DRAFT_681035 [Hyaloraphidium curvatum]
MRCPAPTRRNLLFALQVGGALALFWQLFAAPAAYRPPAHPRVAVCGTDGFRLNILAHADLLHKHLLEPLDADVYAVVTHHRLFPPPGDAPGPLKGVLEALLARDADFSRQERAFDVETRQWMEASPIFGLPSSGERWGRLMAVEVPPMTTSKGYTDLITAGASKTTLDLLRRFGEVENAIGPAFNATGASLPSVLARRRCLDAIRAGEQQRSAELGRAFRYDFVVWTRLQLVHVGPYPPLSLLASRPDTLWTTTNDAYGGLNDRHAFLPRHMADWFLSQWDHMLNGSMDAAIAAVDPGRTLLNGERMLELFVDATKPLGGWKRAEFGPSPFFLDCCAKGEACFFRERHATNATVHYGRPPAPRRREVCAKYVTDTGYLNVTENGAREVGWTERRVAVPNWNAIVEVGPNKWVKRREEKHFNLRRPMVE